MEELTTWTSGVIIILHLIKTALNWTVHNMLNPKQKVKFRLNHPGNIFEKNGIQDANERDLMFVYCGFVFFWLKIPKQKNGKIMAWSVLAISILQIIGVLLLVKFGKNA